MNGLHKILVVEDEPLIRALLEDDLLDAGFHVDVAADGQEAEDLLRQGAALYDALVSDIRLGPGPDGWAVARLARQLNPGIRVVYITADSAGLAGTQAVSDSIVLQKPHQRAELFVALDLLLIDQSGLPDADRFVAGAPPSDEALWSWVYVSRSLLLPEEFEVGMADIVAASKRNNAAADVSGALMAAGPIFAQLIEGPRRNVERIRAAIEADNRHHAIQTLAEGPVERRRFSRWSLAYVGQSRFFQRALWEAPFLSPGSDRNVAAIMARLLSTSAIDA